MHIYILLFVYPIIYTRLIEFVSELTSTNICNLNINQMLIQDKNYSNVITIIKNFRSKGNQILILTEKLWV